MAARLLAAISAACAVPAVLAAPCDIYAASGVPCVAAHSITRALFANYAGPLYQLNLTATGATQDIHPLAPGGFADAAAHDAFCAAAAPAAAALPPLGSVVQLSPLALPALSFRHCDAQGYVTDGADDDHFFTLVAALNNVSGAFSFRSVNFPEWFIAPVTTAEPGRLGLVQAPAAADASWQLAPAAGGGYTLTLAGRGSAAVGSNLTGSCAANYAPPAAGVFLAAQGTAWRIAPAGAPPACAISVIYDQTEFGNHLTVAPAGGAVPRGDKPVDATALSVTAGGGKKVYGAFFAGGNGYRIDNSSGVARGNDPETLYMVTSGKHYNSGCCFVSETAGCARMLLRRRTAAHCGLAQHRRSPPPFAPLQKRISATQKQTIMITELAQWRRCTWGPGPPRRTAAGVAAPARAAQAQARGSWPTWRMGCGAAARPAARTPPCSPPGATLCLPWSRAAATASA